MVSIGRGVQPVIAVWYRMIILYTVVWGIGTIWCNASRSVFSI